MAKAQGIQRAEVIQRMSAALKQGMSASAFISEMQEQGLSYRRSEMLADWRSVGNLQKKEGVLRYVRKDYYPTQATYAQVTWATSKEYMYKLRVESRRAPGEPITSQFVNIVTDNPMTPRELETEVMSRWTGWYPEQAEAIETVTPETAIRRIIE